MNRYACCFLALSLLGWSGSARAEVSGSGTTGDDRASPPEFVERARDLFRLGLELADDGQWTEAAARFEQALALHPAPSIRYNLAAVYVRLERPADAAEQLQMALDDDQTPPSLRSQAEALISELEPDLGRLSIRLDIADQAGDSDQAVVVSLDGRALNQEQLHRPLWVEPGIRVVTAHRGGASIAQREVEIAAGGAAVTTLVVGPQLSDTVDSQVDETAASADDGEGRGEGRRDRRRRRPLSRDGRIWVGVGVGIALAITAVVVGVTVGMREDEVEPPVVGNLGRGVLEWP